MKDYSKPCIKENRPDHLILHVGTNDLASENKAERIAKSIADLAKGSIADDRTVCSKVPRNEKLNGKVVETNSWLETMYSNLNMHFIDNEKVINPKKRLNNSKLQINLNGSAKLRDLFINSNQKHIFNLISTYAKPIFKWQESNLTQIMNKLTDNNFCNLYKLKIVIKVTTYFKNSDNPKNIDLMLTNSIRSFQNSSCPRETGLSDFHKMIVTVLKSYLGKNQPKFISYSDFGKFSNNGFRIQILRDFSILHLSGDYSSLDLNADIYIRALNIYAPKNEKYLKANNSPVMNKAISKTMMDRRSLRNKFLTNRSAENKLA